MWLQDFGGEEIAHGLAAAGEGDCGAFDEDFGWARAGVVVRGLGHSVGSGVEEDDEVAGLDVGDGSVAGEKVTGFADGADDVGCDGG